MLLTMLAVEKPRQNRIPGRPVLYCAVHKCLTYIVTFVCAVLVCRIAYSVLAVCSETLSLRYILHFLLSLYFLFSCYIVFEVLCEHGEGVVWLIHTRIHTLELLHKLSHALLDHFINELPYGKTLQFQSI